jgi:hypothetical protein
MIPLSGVLAWIATALCCTLGPVQGQELPGQMKEKIDSLVSQAYTTAAQGFPCRMKTRGKARMFRWEEVDRCLNDAAARIDWDALAGQLQELRTSTYGISRDAFAAELDKAFSAHALIFDKVFTSKDPKARLPLTNSPALRSAHSPECLPMNAAADCRRPTPTA